MQQHNEGNTRIKHFKNEKRSYLPHCCSDEGLKGTTLNRKYKSKEIKIEDILKLQV